MIQNAQQAVATLKDYVERSTHWQEGGATRHDALQALRQVEGLSTNGCMVVGWVVGSQLSEVTGEGAHSGGTLTLSKTPARGFDTAVLARIGSHHPSAYKVPPYTFKSDDELLTLLSAHDDISEVCLEIAYRVASGEWAPAKQTALTPDSPLA